jgi:cholesterol transport system auxiliary component
MTDAPLRPSRRLLAGAMALAFAGCSRLFVNPPPRYIFRLTPAATFPANLPRPRPRAQLLVFQPTAPAAIDRRRIALTRSALSLDYFADAEWADTVSAMVQTVLANSFENSRSITVISGSLGLRPEFILATEIRHFEAQYGGSGGPPDVLVSIEAKLVAMPEHDVVAQALFERHVPAAGNDLPSIVSAFDAALRGVVTEIVIWSVTDAARRRTQHRV